MTRVDELSVGDITRMLRERIHRGDLSPGDRLPAERVLATDLGVSRVRVRDALAELEAGGYLVTRRGATGGRFVTELSAPYRSWAERMKADVGELDDILDFRLGVERRVVELAAERRTAADLTMLRRTVAQLEASDSPATYRAADAAFHAALAAAARSERLAEAVERSRGELFAPVDDLWLDERTSECIVEHTAIVDAVEAGDAARAVAAISAHIEATRGQVHELLDG